VQLKVTAEYKGFAYGFDGSEDAAAPSCRHFQVHHRPKARDSTIQEIWTFAFARLG